jgi:hypothetical protein
MMTAMSPEPSPSLGASLSGAAGRRWILAVCAVASIASTLVTLRFLGVLSVGASAGPLGPRLGAGVLGGLLVGFVLFKVLHASGSTHPADHEAVLALGVPLLAVVPVMVTARERRAYGREHRVRVIAAVTILLASAAVAAWALFNSV